MLYVMEKREEATLLQKKRARRDPTARILVGSSAQKGADSIFTLHWDRI